jgi:hypothetical protein
LATAGNVSLSSPHTEPASYSKCRTDSDTSSQPVHSDQPSNASQAIASPHQSVIAQDASTQHSRPPNYALPMYSTELGRLPVYGQFNFSDSHANSGSVSFNVDYTSAFAPQTPAVDVRGISAAVDDLLRPGFVTTSPLSNLDQSEALGWSVPAFHEGSTENGGIVHDMPVMDSETITMWSTAPAGFE